MPTNRVFYGWWVVIGFAIMVFISTGVRFTVGPFLKPVVGELGIDRASFSLVVAMGLFLYGAFMPLIGRLVDRLGARPVLVSGCVLLSASMAATGLVTRLWHFALLYGVLLALGLAATGHVVASAVITRWFVRRRATALSLLGGASMAGMSLLVPVVMWLILTLGWRWTYGVIGAVLLAVMLPITLWVVRESPEVMGLTPDGSREAGAVAAVTAERTTVSCAMQSVPFWQLAGGLFTCGFSMSLLSAHGVPMLTDHGYQPMVASWTLGLLGGTAIGFSLILGVMADRFGRRLMLAWIYGARAAAFAGLFLVRDHPTAILMIAALGGMTMGGTMALASALSADVFGRFSVASVLGTIFLVHQTGAALGSWLGGFLFEATGGYGAVFALACTILSCGAVLSLTIDERARVLPRLSPVAGGR
ncbi:MAG: MFS transporter [Candidatus Rokubacteria bacterium]|nr:MFS transporter [Candidatus Rokubacteria bacterium]MBI3824451.1 MFS transporter [Candidatus Rokubacteria bacterium]